MHGQPNIKIYKKKYMEISNLSQPVVVSPGSSVVSLVWCGSLSDKFLMSVDTKLRSGVYHLLPADHECIKVKKVFWASECLLPYFLTFYVSHHFRTIVKLNVWNWNKTVQKITTFFLLTICIYSYFLIFRHQPWNTMYHTGTKKR